MAKLEQTLSKYKQKSPFEASSRLAKQLDKVN